MIYSIVGGDGSARIELDGRKTKIRGRSVDDARIRVLNKAREYAEKTNTVQPMTAVDPSGEWLMYVHPNGDIIPAQDPAAAAPQPATSAPAPAPTPPAYVPPRIHAAPIDSAPTSWPTPSAAPSTAEPAPAVWPDPIDAAPVAPAVWPDPIDAAPVAPAVWPDPIDAAPVASAPAVWPDPIDAAPVAAAPTAGPEPRPVQEAEARRAPAPSEPAAADELEHEATLLVVRRPRAIVVITIEGGSTETRPAPVLIGRKPVARTGHSTLALESIGREVSRTHALVDVDEQGRILITDLQSANGVYINGHELAPDQPTIVPEQTRIELGDATITIGHRDR